MLKTSSKLKAQAREQLKGGLLQIMSATFLVCTISFVVFLITLRIFMYAEDVALSYLILIIGIILHFMVIVPLKMKLISYDLEFINHKNSEDEFVIRGFDRTIEGIILYLLRTLFVFLWSFNFIVPGIIKLISYSMSHYILAENPKMKAREALKWSEKITNKYKGKILWTALSFIGAYIFALVLVLIVYSILVGVAFSEKSDIAPIIVIFLSYVWIMPYKDIVYANLYTNLKELNPEYSAIVADSSDEDLIYETKHN